MKVRFAVAALALAGAMAVSATAANAGTVVFDFSSATGDLGATQTYTASGLSVTASAFGPGVTTWNRWTGWTTTPDHLFGKHNGGDENGLGMTNDPSGENEIHFGDGFVQLDVSALTGDLLTLAFNSTTAGEQWTVYGTNTAGALGSTTITGGHAIGSGSTESSLSFTDSYKYYDIVSTSSSGGRNVLLKSLSVTAVPEPATWGLMIVGFGLVGATMRQRRSALAAV